MLEDYDHDYQRDCHDHGSRQDCAPRLLVFARATELGDNDWHSFHGVSDGKRQGEQKLIPSTDEGQEPGRNQAGHRQWQQDPPEDSQRRCTVHVSSLLEVLR